MALKNKRRIGDPDSRKRKYTQSEREALNITSKKRKYTQEERDSQARPSRKRKFSQEERAMNPNLTSRKRKREEDHSLLEEDVTAQNSPWRPSQNNVIYLQPSIYHDEDEYEEYEDDEDYEDEEDADYDEEDYDEDDDDFYPPSLHRAGYSSSSHFESKGANLAVGAFGIFVIMLIAYGISIQLGAITP